MTIDRSPEAKMKRLVLMYGTGKESFVRGCEAAKAGEPLEYDDSYFENHCPECGEYESECTCEED